MLEDPTHNNIVRWSQTGDSFIVVDVGQAAKARSCELKRLRA